VGIMAGYYLHGRRVCILQRLPRDHVHSRSQLGLMNEANVVYAVKEFCVAGTTVVRITSFFLVLSHMFGYLEQKLRPKLLSRSRKSLFFLQSNFFGSEKFKVSAHVLPK
jgi:hypothetical protein